MRMAQPVGPGERFWAKVVKAGPDECWKWTASMTRTGYGTFGFSGGATYLAHRVSFFLAHGRWPEPCCLHRCDNPGCVNPAHLFEGSQLENVADMDRKKRRARGVALRRNRLSEADIPVIRALHEWSGFTNREVAEEYGVATNTISEITAGRNWTHV